MLLFLLFYKIITPIPPVFETEEGAGGGHGTELALGLDLMGMGEGTGNSAPSQETAPPPPPTTDEATPLTSDVEEEEIPTVKDPKPTKDPKKPTPQPTKPIKPTKEQQEQAFKDKLNTMWNTKGNGDSGHGTTTTPGGEGVPNGKAGGTGIGDGTGVYIGSGTRIDVPGKNIKKRPEINDKPSVGGKVVMDIWVSPQGAVVRAAQNTAKSTTLDQTLVNIAKRACMASTFYPDPKAVSDQRGTITFVFELE